MFFREIPPAHTRTRSATRNPCRAEARAKSMHRLAGARRCVFWVWGLLCYEFAPGGRGIAARLAPRAARGVHGVGSDTLRTRVRFYRLGAAPSSLVLRRLTAIPKFFHSACTTLLPMQRRLCDRASPEGPAWARCTPAKGDSNSQRRPAPTTSTAPAPMSPRTAKRWSTSRRTLKDLPPLPFSAREEGRVGEAKSLRGFRPAATVCQ